MSLKKSSPGIDQHPLMGASFSTLLKAATRNGGVAPGKIFHMLAFAGSALARVPFNLIDRLKLQTNHSVKHVEPPVFIVGYWRSGTTHLHNLLSKSPEMGIITPLASGLPGELLTLGTWFESILHKGLPDDRGVDQVAVTPDSPQEDEIPVANLQLLSVYHGLYFGKYFRKNFEKGVFFEGASPREIEKWKTAMYHFLRKIAVHQQKQPLLIKNPVYTARVDKLRTIWPDARFIHIYRNPYTVYHSTVQYYHKMLQSLSLQGYNPDDIEPVVQQSYPRMLTKLKKDTSGMPVHRFIEIRYEDLDQQPMEVLEKIYKKLNLPGWEQAVPETEKYLDKISDYQKNPHCYNSDLKEKVDRYWGPFVEKWNYSFPRS